MLAWPVFASGALLAGTCRRFVFSKRSCALFTALVSLHLVGARYPWSDVSFGLLLVWLLRKILSRAAGLRPGWSCFVTVATVLGCSGFYAGLEAATAMRAGPELGAARLGTQGDEGDGTKDMMRALAGALPTVVVARATQRRASGAKA